MVRPVLKIVHDSGCQSYLIGCRETGEALLVDPKVGRKKAYQSLLGNYGLKLVAVVDTHTHADHLSDSIGFERLGLPVFMSRFSPCRRRITKVAHGEELRIGELRLRVLEVPGHTDDSIALAGDGFVVSGDTLLPGSLARSDFRGSDAARLFESVQRELLALPDATVVLPGHNYRDVLFTTIGAERRNNASLRHADAAAFARERNDVAGAGNTPDVDHMLRLNAEESPELPETSGPAVACCAAGESLGPLPKAREQAPRDLAGARAGIAASGRWIDVRDPFEFGAGHIEGARNLPLSELGFHLEELGALQGEPLVLQCQGGVRSLTAARTLSWLGVATDAVSLAGGYVAWQKDVGATS